MKLKTQKYNMYSKKMKGEFLLEKLYWRIFPNLEMPNLFLWTLSLIVSLRVINFFDEVLHITPKIFLLKDLLIRHRMMAWFYHAISDHIDFLNFRRLTLKIRHLSCVHFHDSRFLLPPWFLRKKWNFRFFLTNQFTLP